MARWGGQESLPRRAAETLASSHGLAGTGRHLWAWIVRMSAQWEQEQKLAEFTDVGVLFCVRIWHVARTRGQFQDTAQR